MKLIFIDTETSHYTTSGALLQVSGCIEEDGKVLDVFNYHLRPYGKEEWSQGAIDKTGITPEIASQYDNPHEVFESFISLLDKHVSRYDKKDKMFFVAYNASFDTEYIRNWFLKEAKTDKDREYGNGFGCYFWTPSIDVMQLAAIKTMRMRPEFQNFKLESVCKNLGIDWDDEKAHDALYDIKKTRELFYILKRGYKKK